jgi:hypothetical protein
MVKGPPPREVGAKAQPQKKGRHHKKEHEIRFLYCPPSKKLLHTRHWWGMEEKNVLEAFDEKKFFFFFPLFFLISPWLSPRTRGEPKNAESKSKKAKAKEEAEAEEEEEEEEEIFYVEKILNHKGAGVRRPIGF